MNEATASYEARSATNEPGSEARAAVEARTPIKAVEPRTGADECAANEPTGTVVGVRRAGVRGIGGVAIAAHGRRTNVDRADANADHNSLCVCGRCCSQANAKYSEKC